MSARITQQQLESYLWGAATLLRGTIDAGDYKQFIFPLLFYKRLCDVFDEETQAALDGIRRGCGVRVLPGEPPISDSGRRALARGAASGQERRSCASSRHARHRDGQPRQALRHLRRCPMDQQGPAVRRDAARPDRAFQHARTHRRQPARRRAGPGLRIPHQEVRRRLPATPPPSSTPTARLSI